jgi:hypothetical protein
MATAGVRGPWVPPTGVVVGGLVVLVVVVVVAAVWPRAGSANDPEDALRCGQTVASVMDYDENVVDWREPERQALQWMVSTSGPSRGRLHGHRLYYRSATSIKVGFTDRAGDMTAVLVFEKPGSSWRLVSSVECA